MKTASFVLRKGSVPKKYDHINFVPPKGVRDEAKRGLKLRREHGRGGLSTKQASTHGIGSGVQRAATLASGGRVSPGTIKRMRSFFARHSAYKEHHKDRTSAAYISWLLWGGDAGERWANKVYAQMERADEELKKAVAGGERPGHKYIRRIRAMRNGKMGWQYIYKRPNAQRTQRKEAERLNESDIIAMGIDIVDRSQSPLADTDEALAVPLSTGEYVLVNTESLLNAVESDDYKVRWAAINFLFDDLSDLEVEWEPEDLAGALLSSDVDHSGTFTDITNAPMGEQEQLSFDDSTFVDDGESAPNVEGEESEADRRRAEDVASIVRELADLLESEGPTSAEDDAPSTDGADTTSSEDESPDLEAAAEQHETLTETLRENEQLEPLADAIDAIAPVKDGKISLPVKDVGKAIALLTLITAVEAYKTATMENDNAPDLNDLESASRRGLKQIDKDKIAEAKAKMRESLNKERQEAREKMTREKLVARLKERQEKNKAAKEAQERELEFRKQEAERKERRKEEAKDKQAARREEAKDKQAERKKAQAEKRAEIREKQKEKDAARKEKQKEKDAARKEKQKEKDAERKKAQAEKRAEIREKQKEKAAERKEKQKEKDAERKEKQKEKDAERKEKQKEKDAARKEAAKRRDAKRKKAEEQRAMKRKRAADLRKKAERERKEAAKKKKVPKRVPKRVRRANNEATP